MPVRVGGRHRKAGEKRGTAMSGKVPRQNAGRAPDGAPGGSVPKANWAFRNEILMGMVRKHKSFLCLN
jgi:hypothetical protein